MQTYKEQQDINVSGTSPGPYTIDDVPAIDMWDKGQGVIQWDIITPGWRFAQTDGIYFKENEDQMENTPGQVPGQPNRWQANDLNQKAGKWLVKYGINLINTDGATASLDPTIINGH